MSQICLPRAPISKNFFEFSPSQHVLSRGTDRWVSLFTIECSQPEPGLFLSRPFRLLTNNTVCGIVWSGCWWVRFRPRYFNWRQRFINGILWYNHISLCTNSTRNHVGIISNIFIFGRAERIQRLTRNCQLLTDRREPVCRYFILYGMLFSFLCQKKFLIKTILLTKYTGIL